MKPLSDLCWVCQKNSRAMMRAPNTPESEMLQVNQTHVPCATPRNTCVCTASHTCTHVHNLMHTRTCTHSYQHTYKHTHIPLPTHTYPACIQKHSYVHIDHLHKGTQRCRGTPLAGNLKTLLLQELG